MKKNKFLEKIIFNKKEYYYYSLKKVEQYFNISLKKAPFVIKILLENLLVNYDSNFVKKGHIVSLLNFNKKSEQKKEIPFFPYRIILQDFTGVPLVADLALLKDIAKKHKIDLNRVEPKLKTDLVIDHSIQVDKYKTKKCIMQNTKLDYQRNGERYKLLKWAQKSFSSFSVVPPNSGIVHQVNLEYLAEIVGIKNINNKRILLSDTLLGTDSHTTMINSIGVLGWGVGGIEAEAALCGLPYYLLIPRVVGVKLINKLNKGVYATDLVLHITNILREENVVNKFLEFFGDGLSALQCFDRATISNMSPEFGSTCAFFPVDEKTIDYLNLTRNSKEKNDLIKYYLKKQELFSDNNSVSKKFSKIIEIDLSKVKKCIAGPRRPEQLIYLDAIKQKFNAILKEQSAQKHNHVSWANEGGNIKEFKREKIKSIQNKECLIKNGSVVIAAITSCTNTSNPFVLFAAGLLAKNAYKNGLLSKKWVKASIAPGSKTVTAYLKESNLLYYFNKIGFNIVGYGCTTCIGNSGPLDKQIQECIISNDLNVCSVLSGNRNFEGRIHSLIKSNFLTSPVLVVAFALTGRIDFDFFNEPLINKDNRKIFLKDLLPDDDEVIQLMNNYLKKEYFTQCYRDIYKGDELWKNLKVKKSKIYHWTQSEYIKKPNFLDNFNLNKTEPNNIKNAYVLAYLGDSITTDHISPAGQISENSPAGTYLKSKGIKKKNFNSYGSRRGNHEVMARGTFANVRLKNKLVNIEGGYTYCFLNNKIMSIYDAAMEYKKQFKDLIILAGKRYGSGSSRDWAAKGTFLLGVKAVIAQSFERIHRSNLIGMGVLPLEFLKNQSAKSLKLTGKEIFDIIGIDKLSPLKKLKVIAYDLNHTKIKEFYVIARLDNNIEISYYKAKGILPFILSGPLA